MGLFPLRDGLRFVLIHLIVHACAVLGDDFHRHLGILVVLNALGNPGGVVGTSKGKAGAGNSGKHEERGEQVLHRQNTPSFGV